MATNIESPEQFEAAVEASGDKQIVVDFWATWCGPCRTLSPILDQMAEDGVIELVKVDVDQNPEIAAAHEVMSIPTMKFFRAGEENLAPLIGAYPRKNIEQHLAR